MNIMLIRKIVLMLCLVLISGGVGYKLGTNKVDISWKNYTPNVQVSNKLPTNKVADFNLFWQVWDEITTKYVDKTKIDSQKMVYGAISGMVSAIGDPYTMFLPPQKNTE